MTSAELPIVAAELPEVIYPIARTGPDRFRLEALARQYVVADQVFYLGKMPDDALLI